jgi:purine nucleosidase
MIRVLTSFFLLIFLNPFSLLSQKRIVWLDADTANEMDDLYAIIRLLKEDGIDIRGISSAHFNNADLLLFEKWNGYETKGLSTIRKSQLLNEKILDAFRLQDIPHPQGADRQIGLAWGLETPRQSEATNKISEVIRTLKADEKLDILVLGAITNIASLLQLDTLAARKTRIFMLGARYNLKSKAWSKNEFNVRNDLNAFDYMLNRKDINFTIMPVEVAFPLQFDRDKTYENIDVNDRIQYLLKERWMTQNPEHKTRILWDLALVQAYLIPLKARIIKVKPPLENKAPSVKIYSYIDVEYFKNEFWKKVKGN